MKTAMLFVFIAGASAGFIGALTVMKPDVERWQEAYMSTRQVANYFGSALINKGLADLCERDGAPGIWLREECDE